MSREPSQQREPLSVATIARVAEMFGNRVTKNARHLGKWARREAVTCYRVYDQDIPEAPLTVDWYDGAVVVGDRRHQAVFDDAWIAAMITALGTALALPLDRIHVKRRARMSHKDGDQYERLADDVPDEGHFVTVTEAGYRFQVNLTDYLDTGLFLDHRITRDRATREPGATSLLNLFCYTGAFSVYGACRGLATTSVDLSKTYLDWARRNLELNGADLAQHHVVHADVRAFLQGAARAGEYWDLAVVDPPTFSNSKRMDYVWDVQRDHGALLRDVSRVVRPGGVIWFSTNLRRFRFDHDALPEHTIMDMTSQTIPPDFRDQRIHTSFRIVTPA